MPALIWDAQGEHLYETGVDRGVLYPRGSEGDYTLGVAWNGLTAVTETPTGAEPTSLYADNIKYISIVSAEEFTGTIEAYTYPDEFNACNGMAEMAEGVHIGQQERVSFGFSYRTIHGNDVLLNNFGYKLHLWYGCLASPSESGYATVNDSPEAVTFSWDITTTPVAVTGKKPSALMVIDSTKVEATALARLEAVLYGNTGEVGTARMPLPDEVLSILAGTP